ncbi:MAG: bacteriohemerythrin [Candidatus Magnetoovum sp. WYHC-5]|nr:bacteriohemerythrin [Candidatus Magnetoovum sp. WYHC-5]
MQQIALFKWKDLYKVNVKRIDAEHKELVCIVNDLYSAKFQGRGNSETEYIFTRLVEYVNTHFKTEEILMETYNYPGYKPHKIEHEQLASQAIKLKCDIENGKRVITIEIMDFLIKWLTQHILGTDKKMGSFLNSKGLY